MVCVIRSHAAIRLKSRSACSTSIAFRRTSRIRRSFSAPTNSAVDPLDDVGGAIGSPHCGGARGGWARGVGENPAVRVGGEQRVGFRFLVGPGALPGVRTWPLVTLGHPRDLALELEGRA